MQVVVYILYHIIFLLSHMTICKAWSRNLSQKQKVPPHISEYKIFVLNISYHINTCNEAYKIQLTPILHNRIGSVDPAHPILKVINFWVMLWSRSYFHFTRPSQVTIISYIILKTFQTTFTKMKTMMSTMLQILQGLGWFILARKIEITPKTLEVSLQGATLSIGDPWCQCRPMALDKFVDWSVCTVSLW